MGDLQDLKQNVKEFQKGNPADKCGAIGMVTGALCVLLIRKSELHEGSFIWDSLEGLPLRAFLFDGVDLAIGAMVCAIPIFAAIRLAQKFSSEKVATIVACLVGALVNLPLWLSYLNPPAP